MNTFENPLIEIKENLVINVIERVMEIRPIKSINDLRYEKIVDRINNSDEEGAIKFVEMGDYDAADVLNRKKAYESVLVSALKKKFVKLTEFLLSKGVYLGGDQPIINSNGEINHDNEESSIIFNCCDLETLKILLDSGFKISVLTSEEIEQIREAQRPITYDQLFYLVDQALGIRAAEELKMVKTESSESNISISKIVNIVDVAKNLYDAYMHKQVSCIFKTPLPGDSPLIKSMLYERLKHVASRFCNDQTVVQEKMKEIEVLIEFKYLLEKIDIYADLSDNADFAKLVDDISSHNNSNSIIFQLTKMVRQLYDNEKCDDTSNEVFLKNEKIQLMILAALKPMIAESGFPHHLYQKFRDVCSIELAKNFYKHIAKIFSDIENKKAKLVEEETSDSEKSYSADKIQKILKISMHKSNNIFKFFDFSTNKLSSEEIKKLIEEIDFSKIILIATKLPENINIGLAVQKGDDGKLNIIYSDPTGNAMNKKIHDLVTSIEDLTNSDSTNIIDLKIKQVKEGDLESGIYTTENLRQLGAISNLNISKKEIIKKLDILISKEQIFNLHSQIIKDRAPYDQEKIEKLLKPGISNLTDFIIINSKFLTPSESKDYKSVIKKINDLKNQETFAVILNDFNSWSSILLYKNHRGEISLVHLDLNNRSLGEKKELGKVIEKVITHNESVKIVNLKGPDIKYEIEDNGAVLTEYLRKISETLSTSSSRSSISISSLKKLLKEDIDVVDLRKKHNDILNKENDIIIKEEESLTKQDVESKYTETEGDIEKTKNNSKLEVTSSNQDNIHNVHKILGMTVLQDYFADSDTTLGTSSETHIIGVD